MSLPAGTTGFHPGIARRCAGRTFVAGNDAAGEAEDPGVACELPDGLALADAVGLADGLALTDGLVVTVAGGEAGLGDTDRVGGTEAV